MTSRETRPNEVETVGALRDLMHFYARELEALVRAAEQCLTALNWARSSKLRNVFFLDADIIYGSVKRTYVQQLVEPTRNLADLDIVPFEPTSLDYASVSESAFESSRSGCQLGDLLGPQAIRCSLGVVESHCLPDGSLAELALLDLGIERKASDYATDIGRRIDRSLERLDAGDSYLRHLSLNPAERSGLIDDFIGLAEGIAEKQFVSTLLHNAIPISEFMDEPSKSTARKVFPGAYRSLKSRRPTTQYKQYERANFCDAQNIATVLRAFTTSLRRKTGRFLPQLVSGTVPVRDTIDDIEKRTVGRRPGFPRLSADQDYLLLMTAFARASDWNQRLMQDMTELLHEGARDLHNTTTSILQMADRAPVEAAVSDKGNHDIKDQLAILEQQAIEFCQDWAPLLTVPEMSRRADAADAVNCLLSMRIEGPSTRLADQIPPPVRDELIKALRADSRLLTVIGRMLPFRDLQIRGQELRGGPHGLAGFDIRSVANDNARLLEIRQPKSQVDSSPSDPGLRSFAVMHPYVSNEALLTVEQSHDHRQRGAISIRWRQAVDAERLAKFAVEFVSGANAASAREIAAVECILIDEKADSSTAIRQVEPQEVTSALVSSATCTYFELRSEAAVVAAHLADPPTGERQILCSVPVESWTRTARQIVARGLEDTNAVEVPRSVWESILKVVARDLNVREW